jgi:hypothetical protein
LARAGFFSHKDAFSVGILHAKSDSGIFSPYSNFQGSPHPLDKAGFFSHKDVISLCILHAKLDYVNLSFYSFFEAGGVITQAIAMSSNPSLYLGRARYSLVIKDLI